VSTQQQISLPVAARNGDLLQAFVDASDALVCIVDGEGRVLFANPALRRFIGRGADELLGRRFWEVFVVPERVALARDAVERAMASGTTSPQDTEWMNRDGERRSVYMRNTVIRDEAGRPYAIGCVAVDVTDDRRREAQLHLRAQTDLLTGIANRGAFFDALRALLAEDVVCGLLFCDLDGFKRVNDEFGHTVGDALLADVARRMALLADPDDLVARFGGDEFVILCPHGQLDRLTLLAEQVAETVRTPFSGPDGPLIVGVSVGIAVSRTGETADDLVGRADRAMYGAKIHPHRQAGRPRRSGDTRA
jgi:diguanylate cyclase (GGDEF)-like protein/PAS domain S-box-containing protein